MRNDTRGSPTPPFALYRFPPPPTWASKVKSLPHRLYHYICIFALQNSCFDLSVCFQRVVIRSNCSIAAEAACVEKVSRESGVTWTGSRMCTHYYITHTIGLLKVLKPISRPTSLADKRGQTAAIDGYGWLHRAAYCCSVDLVLGRPTNRYLVFCMHLINVMRANGVTPYVVFDGAELPGKSLVNKRRGR